MTNDYPSASIEEQSLTHTPTASDATIMDDTSMVMDGTALMGGPVTIIEEIQSTVEIDRVFTEIPRGF